MGAVSKPGRELEKKKEDLLRDLSPGVRDTVKKLMDTYQGKDLEKRLNEIIEAKRIGEPVEEG